MGNDVTVPVSIAIYNACGPTCSAPSLFKTISLSSSLANNAVDRYGNKFISLNSGSLASQCNTNAQGCRATFRNGRLVPSGNGGSLVMTGECCNRSRGSSVTAA